MAPSSASANTSMWPSGYASVERWPSPTPPNDANDVQLLEDATYSSDSVVPFDRPSNTSAVCPLPPAQNTLATPHDAGPPSETAAFQLSPFDASASVLSTLDAVPDVAVAYSST